MTSAGLNVTDAVTVLHAPTVDNTSQVQGTLRLLSGENVALAGHSAITVGLRVPGIPTVTKTVNVQLGSTYSGGGSSQPSNYTIALTGFAQVGAVINRTDPTALPLVPAPPPPIGTRDVVISAHGQSPGDFTTIRDLTIQTTAGSVAVPAGTYRNFVLHTHGNGIILGVAGSTTPSVYNLQTLTVDTRASIQLLGPVTINVAGLTLITGFTIVGSLANPAWLTINGSNGNIEVCDGSTMYGIAIAPTSTVQVTGSSLLVGATLSANLYEVQNATIRFLAGTTNQAPVVNPGPNQTLGLPTNTTTLNGSVNDDGLPIGGALTQSWSEISGPGSVAFATSSQAVTQATFPVPGVYDVKLTANDSLLTGSADATITVLQTYSIVPPGTINATLGNAAPVTMTLLDSAGLPVSGQTLNFAVTGANSATGSAVTSAAGTATFSYSGTIAGIDTVVASYTTADSRIFTSPPAIVQWSINGVPAPNCSSTVFTTKSVTASAGGFLNLSPSTGGQLTLTIPAGSLSGDATVGVFEISQGNLPGPLGRKTHKVGGVHHNTYHQGTGNVYVYGFCASFGGKTLSLPVALTGASMVPQGLGGPGTILTVAIYSNGSYQDVGTLVVGANGSFSSQPATPSMPGVKGDGQYIIYAQPAHIPSSAYVLMPRDARNGSAFGGQYIRIEDPTGNPLATPTMNLIGLPLDEYFGASLSADASTGLLLGYATNLLYKFNVDPLGRGIVSPITLEPWIPQDFELNTLQLTDSDELIVYSRTTPTEGANDRFKVVSGMTAGNPQIAENVDSQPGDANRRFALNLAPDNSYFLARGFTGLSVWRIDPITPQPGPLGGTISHNYTLAADLPNKGSGSPPSAGIVFSREYGKGEMAISPSDPTRAFLAGIDQTDNTDDVQLITGLPNAPQVQEFHTKLQAGGYYGAVSITPDGRYAIVGTYTGGILVYSGIDTGNVQQVGQAYQPSVQFLSTDPTSVSPFQNIRSLGVTPDGKFVVAVAVGPGGLGTTTTGPGYTLLLTIPILQGGVLGNPVGKLENVAVSQADDMQVGSVPQVNVPAPPVATLTVSPSIIAPTPPGNPVSFVVKAVDAKGAPIANQPITLTIGSNCPNCVTLPLGAPFPPTPSPNILFGHGGVKTHSLITTLSGTTDPSGSVTFTFTDPNPGVDSFQASTTFASTAIVSSTAFFMWGSPPTFYTPPPSPTPTPSGSPSPSPSPSGSPGQINVAITSPTDGATVTSPADVIGSVSTNSWRVEYALNGGDSTNPTWVTIATGTAPVTNSKLAAFDPTVLLNGTYAVRLTGIDGLGHTLSTSISVMVNGAQKLGDFSLTFTDLSVPVAGVPVQVLRTYDSRDKRIDDFGIGWSLSVKDVRVEKTGVLGADWYETSTGGQFPQYCLSPLRPKFVTVTFPDGRVFQFQGTTAPSCQSLSPISGATYTFTQVPGTASTSGATLVATNGNPAVVVNGSVPGPVSLVDQSTSQNYSPTTFKLTMRDGSTYTVDESAELLSSSDLNGNTLTFSSSGITSSNGKSIAFVRDGQDRIIKITDPNGHALNYYYDANGNLATFADRDGNTSTFKYDSNHYLLSYLVPGSTQPIKNTYDASGRVLTTTDGNGKSIIFNYDIGSRQEIVRDRLGNPTLYAYNANGDVVETVDALSAATTMTYDAQDDLLTKTDALGNTTTYTYDSFGGKQTETDPRGNITTITYDGFERVKTLKDGLGNTTTNSYDGNGNLLSTQDGALKTTTYINNPNGLPSSMTDPLNHQTQYGYDSSGRLVSVTDPLGRVTTNSYDSNGNRLTQSVVLGGQTLTTSYQYDGNGNLVKTTFPDDASTQTQYDQVGRRFKSIDQLGRVTKSTYDTVGNLTQVLYPDNTTDGSQFDANGNKLTSTDRANRSTSYKYDTDNRLVKTTYVDGKTTTTTYDGIGRVVQRTDELGNVTASQYDAAGNRSIATDGMGKSTTYTYDGANNVASMIDADGNTTQYFFDGDNRPTTTRYMDGTTAVTAYYDDGHVKSKTDQAANATQFGYDADGRLNVVTDALNHATGYAYDELGEQVSQTDANNHTTTFAYDKLGRKIGRSLPAGQSESMSFDAAGNLGTHVDFNGRNTSFLYDTMNRLLKKTPDPALGQTTVTFTYTATGQRLTMVDASGSTSYTYDPRDRMKTKVGPQGTLTYGYDSSEDLQTITSSHANGASVTYGYDPDRRLGSVTDARLGNAVTTYGYDPAGNLATVTLPNGVQSTYTYDTLNRLKILSIAKGPTIASYTYGLGPAGNRTSVTENSGRLAVYGYDTTYRLKTETISGSANSQENGAIGYSYDNVGNRQSRTSTVPAVPASSSTFDADDRLLSDGYDANGNTTVSGSNTYRFDFENHLTSQNSGATAIVYDGDGNRVSESVGGVTTQYLVDSQNPTGYAQVVDESQGGNVVRQYTYGLSLNSQNQLIAGSWKASYYAYDGQGSVRFLIDGTGAVTDTYDYDAFGNLTGKTGTTPNVYLYDGQQSDPNLGFYYNRARYYNQASGRFATMDTAVGSSQDPATLHRYVYTANDPFDRIDPSGLFSINEESFVSSIIGNWARTTITTGAGIYIRVAADLWKIPEIINTAGNWLTISAGLLSIAEGMTGNLINADNLRVSQNNPYPPGNFPRGIQIGHDAGQNLADNFPEIDDFRDGVATSIKSTTAVTSRQTFLSNVGNWAAELSDAGVNDKLRGKSATGGGITINPGQINTRVLLVAMPARGVGFALSEIQPQLQQVSAVTGVTIVVQGLESLEAAEGR